MLTVWLKQIHPPPTWYILIDALESPPVGEMALADKLRAKYCRLTERANQTYVTAPESSFLPHISQGVYPILAE